jgi:hypothetical protein
LVDLDNGHQDAQSNRHGTETHDTASLEGSLESTFQILSGLESSPIVGSSSNRHSYKTTNHGGYATNDESNGGIELDLGLTIMPNIVNQEEDYNRKDDHENAHKLEFLGQESSGTFLDLHSYRINLHQFILLNQILRLPITLGQITTTLFGGRD